MRLSKFREGTCTTWYEEEARYQFYKRRLISMFLIGVHNKSHVECDLDIWINCFFFYFYFLFLDKIFILNVCESALYPTVAAHGKIL
jgi:hypothetical protein